LQTSTFKKYFAPDVDKFVTLHLQSFFGRAKLVMAEQIFETKNALKNTENIESRLKKKKRY